MGLCKGRGRLGTLLGWSKGLWSGWLLACPTLLSGIPPCPAAALPFPLPVYSQLPAGRGGGSTAAGQELLSLSAPPRPCSRQGPGSWSHSHPVSLCPLSVPALGQPWC